MPVKISEIKNLTQNKVIGAADAAKFDNQTQFKSTIKNVAVTATDWAEVKADDNIQVTWKDGAKVVARAVGGTVTVKDKEVTISGLVDVSKYHIGLNGQIAIGPKNKPAEAALLSVRLGNMPSQSNPKSDWLVDFSDKTDKAEGSKINLTVLIDWIMDTSGDSNRPELPEIKGEDGQPKTGNDFIIEFKDFYFNITQKTFDVNVASAEGSTITFGDFTIKKAGFRVTNAAVEIEPVTETKEIAE